MPPPVSPIHGERAEALGFPPGAHVVRLSTTGGPIGSRTAEAWAVVTEPPRNILLGWAERKAGTGEWLIIAESAPGSAALAALFDRTTRRATAFARLAELARLTAPHALAYQGPMHGPFVNEIVVGGKLYNYRPPSVAECDEVVARIRALRAETGAMVSEVMRTMRAVMAPAAIDDMTARLRQAGDGLDYQAMISALSEIIRRTRAAAVEGEPADDEQPGPA